MTPITVFSLVVEWDDAIGTELFRSDDECWAALRARFRAEERYPFEGQYTQEELDEMSDDTFRESLQDNGVWPTIEEHTLEV